jgi:hypothetical protein
MVNDLLGSEDTESADLSIGAGIGRSAERNSTGPPILSVCAKTGSVPMIRHNPPAEACRSIDRILVTIA